MKELSKSAQSVQTALLERGHEIKVIELSSSARTAVDAANALGCEIAQIIKSLLFRTDTTHQPVLILISGINRVNETSIEKLLGEKIVKADANFTRDITGFVIGGIPPLGHKQFIQHIFIDEDLLKWDILWAAAGTPHAVFALHSNHLLNLINGKIVSVK